MSTWEQLPAGQRARIEAGEAAMVWIKQGHSVERWREIGIASLDLMQAAMRAANTNKAGGKGYNHEWNELGKYVPHLVGLNSGTRAHAVWLAREWETINAWLHDTSQVPVRLRMQLNHPTTIWRRYDKAHKPPADRAAKREAAWPKAVREALAERDARIAALEQRLAREGSLFNLETDTAESIGRVLAAHVGIDKALQIAKAVSAHAKAKKARAAYAG